MQNQYKKRKNNQNNNQKNNQKNNQQNNQNNQNKRKQEASNNIKSICLLVKDFDEAINFYKKINFEVKDDVKYGENNENRWVNKFSLSFMLK